MRLGEETCVIDGAGEDDFSPLFLFDWCIVGRRLSTDIVEEEGDGAVAMMSTW
jgi:hypothetical protein